MGVERQSGVCFRRAGKREDQWLDGFESPGDSRGSTVKIRRPIFENRKGCGTTASADHEKRKGKGQANRIHFLARLIIVTWRRGSV